MYHDAWRFRVKCKSEPLQGIDFSRQNLTSVDVRFRRLKSILRVSPGSPDGRMDVSSEMLGLKFIRYIFKYDI